MNGRRIFVASSDSTVYFFLAWIPNKVNKICFLIFKFQSAVFKKFDEFISNFMGRTTPLLLQNTAHISVAPFLLQMGLNSKNVQDVDPLKSKK